MSRRPLVFVSALTAGDYLLWNWSLSGNRAVLALLAGLTLPPLALACLWLLALTLARAIARATRRRPALGTTGARHRAPAPAGQAGSPIDASHAAAAAEERAGESRKLAA